LQAKSKQIANSGPLNNVGSCDQRATECKFQAVGMPVEVVVKEQLIANCRQYECQLKQFCKEQVDCKW